MELVYRVEANTTKQIPIGAVPEGVRLDVHWSGTVVKGRFAGASIQRVDYLLRKGLVHETVGGKALDRAMEIARRLSSFTPESVAYIKRLVRNATEKPLHRDWHSNEISS